MALRQKSRRVDLNLLKHGQHGKAPVAERERPAAAGHAVEGTPARTLAGHMSMRTHTVSLSAAHFSGHVSRRTYEASPRAGRAGGPQAVGRGEAAALSADTQLSADTRSSLVPLAKLAAAATHSSTMPLARLALVQGHEATSPLRPQVQDSTRLRPGSSRSGLRLSRGLAGSKHMLCQNNPDMKHE